MHEEKSPSHSRGDGTGKSLQGGDEDEEIAEPMKPDHRRRPGYLGRGTPSTRYEHDKGKDGQQLRVTGL